jgi:polyhydroxybutyrate depolymerase
MMRRDAVGPVVLLLALLATGCGGKGSSLPALPSPARGGDFFLSLEHGGLDRSYVLHVPPSYRPPRPLPLVVVLHGAFNNALGMARDTGFNALADREGFLVAYPNGIGLQGKLQHWNGGFCCGKALRKQVDDVGFVAEVVADVGRHLEVEEGGAYLAGMSNGGMLTYLIAVRRPDLVRAIGVVAGSFGRAPKAEGEAVPEGAGWALPWPPSPLTAILIHGRDDDRLPHSPTPPEQGAPISALEAAAFWAAVDGCGAEPRVERSGPIEERRWQDCSSGRSVVLFSLDGWPHAWPGGPRRQAAAGFDAATTLWQEWRQLEKR